MNAVRTAGDIIREDRNNRGLSIDQFAAEIGVKPHVLKYAERGGRPQPQNAKCIADYYAVKVTDLWPMTSSAGAS